MILNEYTDEILSEQYYGKNKSLQEADALFSNAITIANNYKDQAELFTGLKKLEPKLEKIVKDLFNFYDVDIQFQLLGCVNAYTMSSLNIFNQMINSDKYSKTKSPTGIRYKNKVKSAQIVIGVELLKCEGATGRMITGVLLHEIGHNFYYEDSLAYGLGKMVTLVGLILSIPQNPINSIILANFASENYKNLNVKSLNQQQKSFELNDVGNRILAGFLGVASSTFGLAMALASGPMVILLNILNSIKGLFNALFNPFNVLGTKYREEQFADNFATAYGYGKEVLEFEKIIIKGDNSLVQTYLNKNKFTAMYSDFVFNSYQLFGSFSDVHPDGIARCIDQITYLEKNLNLVENKAHRDKIKKDLEEAKKVYNDMIKDIKEDKSFAASGKILSQRILEKNIENKGAMSYRTIKKGNASGNWKALV